MRRKLWHVGLGGLALALAAGAGILLAMRDINSSLVGPWKDPTGRILPDRSATRLVLKVVAGPDACGLGGMTFLTMAWPPGTVVRAPTFHDFRRGRAREYIRDPDGAIQKLGPWTLAATFDPEANLPPDASPTGFHKGPWQLWISPSDADRAIYLVTDDKVERWPRAHVKRQIACA
ncbi:MAG: hypothetical protein M3N24_03900 [Actinomycetota bacterium]|nr:hypothetical protein [Actinomycetota bacterium]